MEPLHLLLFASTAIVLILIPGPDMLYVATRGVSQGRRVAALSVAGVCLGYVAHTLLATLGLSALVASSAEAFQVVRWAGATYLLYLGLKTLRDKTTFLPVGGGPAAPPGTVLRQGAFTSFLNPKGILFFMSFLPQFVVPEAGPVVLQVAGFGLAFTAMCALVYGTVGVFSGSVGDRLRRSARLADGLRWLTGSVLVGLGLRLVVPDRR